MITNEKNCFAPARFRHAKYEQLYTGIEALRILDFVQFFSFSTGALHTLVRVNNRCLFPIRQNGESSNY